MDRKIIIAIDGLSSCGKSTLAKSISESLNYVYIDSGAMYRAVTLYLIQNNICINDEKSIRESVKNIKIHFEKVNGKNSTFLNGVNVESEIRKMNVSNFVSEVSEISIIREFLVKLQRNMGKVGCVVMDGRDIGTVVFPDADLKIFMTADVEERTKRRFLEMKSKGIQINYEDIKENLIKRDFIDSNRDDSPLCKAKDSITIDNTNLSLIDQLSMVIDIISKIN